MYYTYLGTALRTELVLALGSLLALGPKTGLVMGETRSIYDREGTGGINSMISGLRFVKTTNIGSEKAIPK